MPYEPKCSKTIRFSETGVVRSVARCRGIIRPSETGGVRSVAAEEADEHRTHHLHSPSASNFDMKETCCNSADTDLRYTGGEVDAPRSRGRILLETIEGASSTYEAVFAHYCTPSVSYTHLTLPTILLV